MEIQTHSDNKMLKKLKRYHHRFDYWMKNWKAKNKINTKKCVWENELIIKSLALIEFHSILKRMEQDKKQMKTEHICSIAVHGSAAQL